MRTQLNVAAVAALLCFSAITVWIRFVPDPVSRPMFTWTLAGAAFFAVFAIVFIGRARPVTSIAQVLHDIEHPQDTR